MPSSFNRCSALAGREPSRVPIFSFEFVFIYLSPSHLSQRCSVPVYSLPCSTHASVLNSARGSSLVRKSGIITRVKSKGESGVSCHSPDPPISVDPPRAHPTPNSIPGVSGEDSLQQLACYLPLPPITGLAPLGHVQGKEHANEAALLSGARLWLWAGHAEPAHEPGPDASRP